jgi:hypothetical protein
MNIQNASSITKSSTGDFVGEASTLGLRGWPASIEVPKESVGIEIPKEGHWAKTTTFIRDTPDVHHGEVTGMWYEGWHANKNIRLLVIND